MADVIKIRPPGGDTRHLAAITASGAFVPLDQLAGSVDFTDQKLFPTGFPEIDRMLGGGYEPGLHIIGGYQHNGKTLFARNIIARTRDKVVLFFSPDETERIIVPQLYGMFNEGERTTSNKAFVNFVREELPNLALHTRVATVGREKDGAGGIMDTYKEVVDHYGTCDAVIFDYAKLLTGMGDSMEHKLEWFKAKAAETDIPWIIIHQSNRPNGRPGFRADDLNFGGERPAFTVVGAWQRIKFAQELELNHEQVAHLKANPQMNIVLAKNKQRPQVDDTSGTAYSILPSGFMEPMRAEPKRTPQRQEGESMADALSRMRREMMATDDEAMHA